MIRKVICRVDTPTPENQDTGSGTGSQEDPECPFRAAVSGMGHDPPGPDIQTHLTADAEVCTNCVECFSFQIPLIFLNDIKPMTVEIFDSNAHGVLGYQESLSQESKNRRPEILF